MKSVKSNSNTLQLRECFNISTQYKDFNLSINSKADDDQEVPKGCDHNANLVIATDDDDGGADGGDIDNDGADYDNYLQMFLMVLIIMII